MNKNEYGWYVQGCYAQEEIINKIGEITKSLCEEFDGLSASIRNTKNNALQCLEIDFRYNFTYAKYIINPHEIFDLDLFEKNFIKRVINEVIHRDGGVIVRFEGV